MRRAKNHENSQFGNRGGHPLRAWGMFLENRRRHGQGRHYGGDDGNKGLIDVAQETIDLLPSHSVSISGKCIEMVPKPASKEANGGT